MKKRILPALLALCMVMALLPATVFATKTSTCSCTDQDCSACTETDPCKHSGCDNVCNDPDCKATASAPHGKAADATGHQWKCGCTDGTAAACKNSAHTNAAKDCTGTAATKGGLCDACENGTGGDPVTPPAPETLTCTDCGCEVKEGSACTIGGKFGAASTACGHSAESYKGSRGARCAYSVCTNMDCTGYGKNAKDHEHEMASEGNCESAGQFNDKKVNCESDNAHYDGCPMKCPVAGCNKNKGHDGKHASTQTTCTNDAKCAIAVDTAANIAKHKSTCPALEDAVLSDGDTKEWYIYEKTYNVEDDCECTTTAHGHEATCGKALKGTYSISVKVEIDKAETEADKIRNAETGAATNGIDDAKSAALTAWEEDHTVDDMLMCDDCVKAIAAADTKLCTGTVGCTVADGTHKKDCLSLCTMSSTCKNSVGKSEAHQMWYRVEQIVVDDDNIVNGTYADRADAVALLNDLRAAVGAEDTTTKYQMVAVHCPRAGVADSVMVAADETAETTDPTDPTTPEVKAPEKAEDFADLKGDEWYAEDLTALVEKGIFTGSLDDGKYSFNATGNVTGAELVVLLSRVAGEDLVTTGAEWNKAATAWAAEAGYTEGLDINTTGKLTRQDVILILWRAAGKPDSEQELSFTDAEGLEGDYLTAMKWAVEKKIIGGYEDNTVKPDGNITRAEMVTVLTRYDAVK